MTRRADPETLWRLVREERRSLAEAARIMGLTPSGVSRAVNKIAAERGEPTTKAAGGRPPVGHRPRLDDKRLWLLVVGEGYSDECAAALLGCSARSVRVSLKRRAAEVGWQGPLPRGTRRRLEQPVPVKGWKKEGT